MAGTRAGESRGYRLLHGSAIIHPTNAYFALDPRYLDEPGEDFHSFRALAERSQLADAIKDAAVVTQVPELGPVWNRQVQAQQGWKHFQARRL